MEFITRMHLLEQDNDFPIHVFLNSTGGSWFEALAIYDFVKSCGTQTQVECFGLVASAAVPIVQAFSTRLVHPSTTIVIHNGRHHSGEASCLDYENWAVNSKVERERMYTLLSSRSSVQPDFWRARCAEGDFILTPMQALEYQLFDGIIGAS